MRCRKSKPRSETVSALGRLRAPGIESKTYGVNRGIRKQKTDCPFQKKEVR